MKTGNKKNNPNQDEDLDEKDQDNNDEGLDDDKDFVKIPKDKWDRMYARTKSAEDEIKKIKSEKEEQEKQQLEKKQEWETLYQRTAKEKEELEKKGEQYNIALERTQAIIDRKLEQIPEDKKSLIPKGLDPLDLLDYIEANSEHFFGSAGSEFNQKGTPKSKNVADELTQKKKRFKELKDKQTEKGFLSTSERTEFLDLADYLDLEEEKAEREKYKNA